LTALIERSARGLSRGFYAPEVVESALRHVFGVDSRLLADGTYFVVEDARGLFGAGGWSRRRTLYGGDQRPVTGADRHATGSDALDPSHEPAKIRAFFVAPERARSGVGRRLLRACLAAARGAGFTRLELMATLPGVPFYEALGFRELERVVDTLPDGTAIEFVRMERRIGSPAP
jgi:GNAT superfamily N-acetyltransferase